MLRRALVLLLALPLVLSLAACVPDAPRSGPGGIDCSRAARSLAFLEWLGRASEGHGLHALLDAWRHFAERRLAHGLAEHCVRLNELQGVGTHNSYHVEPRPELFELLLAFDPQAFLEWDYRHRSLPEQLEALGMRQIELDVFADEEGGRYATPAGRRLFNLEAPLPGLEEPGFKVLHVQDLDYETTCATLVACLEQVEAWSEANPRHLPVAILIEAKDATIPDPLDLGFVAPEPIDAAAFRALDAEILSVFRRDEILTPDDVRGGAETLEDAVLGGGWPTLGAARGKVLFLLDNGGKAEAYRDGRPSLRGRILFTNAVPGDPDAAFVKVNDPQGGDPTLIPDLVEQGYLVRTRADAGLVSEPERRDAALASGAQLVSTDFPEPRPELAGEREEVDTDYAVSLPEGRVARCNPVNAPAGCRSDALE